MTTFELISYLISSCIFTTVVIFYIKENIKNKDKEQLTKNMLWLIIGLTPMSMIIVFVMAAFLFILGIYTGLEKISDLIINKIKL